MSTKCGETIVQAPLVGLPGLAVVMRRNLLRRLGGLGLNMGL